MTINFHNQTKQNIVETKKLIRTIFKPIKQKKNMQIIFVDNEGIKEINKAYRKKDVPTDVISFPNDDPIDTSLGDIFISLEQAFIQAELYGHTYEREVGFLAVHGYLHLLGYDHHTELEEKEMIALQEQILENANLKRG